jgi:flagellar hook-associated protein 1
MSLMDSVYISRSALLAQQVRLGVTGQNMANVDTEGYHRRTVSLSANPASATGMDASGRRYVVGAGVHVSDVGRIQSQAKENVLRGQLSDSGYYGARGSALSDLESILQVDGRIGLSEDLQDFWNGWQDVANRPDDTAARNALVERAVTLTVRVRSLASRTEGYRSSILGPGASVPSGLVVDDIGLLNTKLSEIADLNSRISKMQTMLEPHDLIDQRDLLVREVSDLAPVSVGLDGSLTLGGEILVNRDGSLLSPVAITDSLLPAEFTVGGVPVAFDSGRIAGLADACGAADDLIHTLDQFANSLLTSVNALHTSGYDLNGNAGVELFSGTDTDGDGLIDASTLMLNSVIYDENSPNGGAAALVAAAETRYSAGPPPLANSGDGALALQIAALAYAPLTPLDEQTLHGYIDSAVTVLGSDVRSSFDLAGDAVAAVAMLDASIQQDVGVNLDEEMINMMTTQRAYEAAARVMSTIDEMLNTIINKL